MVSLNYESRELSCKIVYYGPGLCGKTTNLQVIHQRVPTKNRSDMVSLATESDRTLFFDFLPLDLGSIKGYSTKFQLYTVPGQVYYNETRKMVLRGADGVVFVADSQATMREENLESLKNLETNLKEQNVNIDDVALVFQYNKRDLPDLISVEALNRELNRWDAPFFESSAAQGKGVFEALKAIGKIVIDTYNTKYGGVTSAGSYKKKSVTTAAAPVPEPVSQPAPEPQPLPESQPVPELSEVKPPKNRPADSPELAATPPVEDDDIDPEIMAYINRKKGDSTPTTPPTPTIESPTEPAPALESDSEPESISTLDLSVEPKAAPQIETSQSESKFQPSQNDFDPGAIELSQTDEDISWSPDSTQTDSEPNAIDPGQIDIIVPAEETSTTSAESFDPGAIELNSEPENPKDQDDEAEEDEDADALFLTADDVENAPDTFFLSDTDAETKKENQNNLDAELSEPSGTPIQPMEPKDLPPESPKPLESESSDDNDFFDIQPFTGTDENEEDTSVPEKSSFSFRDALDADDDDDLDFNPYGSSADDKN